jgi:Ca2+-binding RTX toxin-like protein
LLAAATLTALLVLLAGAPGATAAVIRGTAGDDRLIGTPRNDDVLARGGDDVVLTRQGRDFVSGGGGADLVVAGRGADTAFGAAGDDVLRGGRGADSLTDWVPTSFDTDGPADADRLYGGPGADSIGITRGTDVVHAGPGNDEVKLADDGVADTVRCGAGRDRVLYFADAADPLDVLVGCERVRVVS